MATGDRKEGGFWDRFEEVEKKWKKDRDAKRLNDARELRDAEEDYERSVHSLNPFETHPKPKNILGTQAREPSIKRLPLKDPQPCPIVMPAGIAHIDFPSRAEALISFLIEEGEGEKVLEPAAFQIKKIIEYVIDERVLFFLQPKEKGSLLIRKACDNDAPPFFEISVSLPKAIHIKVLEETLTWSPGHIFDCREILKLIIKRLKKTI